MNEVLEELWRRRSVRAFTDEPVTAADERTILEAACQAPTAGNLQLYSIVVVRDQKQKERLAQTCDNQPFIARAPLVLAFCLDLRRWWRAFRAAGVEPREMGPGDVALAFEDTIIAAQNAVVAAESLGIGSCYIGDILERRADQRAILGLPEGVEACALVVFGHPTDQQRARMKPSRFDLDVVMHEGNYHDLPPEMLDQAIAGKERGDAAAVYGRKFAAPFMAEMNRSVEEALECYPYHGDVQA